jgi:hypothetical protein
MANVPRGSYSEAFGIKKIRQGPQQYISKVLNGSATYNPGAIATVTGANSADITVTGAALGDRVNVFPPYSLQGVIASGYVKAADTVVIQLFNPTGGSVTLASGTWNVQVVGNE